MSAYIEIILSLQLSVFSYARLIRDKLESGWIAWKSTTDCFLAPHATKSTFQPWDAGSDDVVSMVRSVTTDPSFWKKLSTHYSAENSSDVIMQDNMCFVKSICEPAAKRSRPSY